MTAKKSLQKNQDGLVSIVVTLIIMIILSLIVVGFAQMARREQRNALDRQLATQALYAAESGVNDADNILQDKKDAGIIDYEHTTCTPGPAGYTSTLEASDNIKYTCMLLKQRLPDYRNQSVSPKQSTIIPINSEATPLTDVTMHWQNKTDPQSISSGYAWPALSSATNWGSNISVMRIDLVKADIMSFTAFDTNTFTFFAYPMDNTGTETVAFTPGSGDHGKIVQAKCADTGPDRPKRCRIKITGVGGGSRYFMRIKPVYNISDVEICYNLCNGETTSIGAQVEIDVTGRANDVLKRIQVRRDVKDEISNSTDKQDFALESGDSICKLLSTVPGPQSTIIDSCP